MIRNRVQAARAGRNKQVGNIGSLTDCAGTEDQYLGKVLLHERTEYLEVATVSGRAIGWCAARPSEIRLVHELCGCNGAANRAGIGEKAERLIRHPDAGRVAGAWAH